MLTTTGSIPIPSAPQSLALVAFGVIQMAVPYILLARGLREIGAPEAGLISLIEPVLNPIWVILVHQEVPTRPTLVGGLFLLAGLIYTTWPGRQALVKPDVPGGASVERSSASGPEF
jgi:drug/metabolite transporter (DMT)-like permease